MKNLAKKKALSLALVAGLTLVAAMDAHAGNGGRGGGDLCQRRIEDIRNDIERWIEASKRSTSEKKYGSAQLDFSGTPFDLDRYNEGMQTQIELTRDEPQTSIVCTNDQTQVRVDGKDKVCVAYHEGDKPRILCYRGETRDEGSYVNGFMGASEDEQYFQIHHEFAVLAGLEDLKGAETNYSFSKQIVKRFMENKVVRQLAIDISILPPPVDESAPSLAGVANDIWEGIKGNKTLIIPRQVEAMSGVRSRQAILEVRLRTQLYSENEKPGESGQVIPIWLTVVFDPTHPGNLAYARLSAAAMGAHSSWRGGGGDIHILRAGITVGLDSKTRTTLSGAALLGADLYQYLDITSDGRVQLYLRGTTNLGGTGDSIRSIDPADSNSTLAMGEIGVRLLKRALFHGGGRVNFLTDFTNKDDPSILEGFAPGLGGGVDFQLSDKLRVSASGFWLDTSKLQNNDGVPSVKGALGGVQFDFW